jgi:hypothetical protein
MAQISGVALNGDDITRVPGINQKSRAAFYRLSVFGSLAAAVTIC